jgi:hypothetical protein
MSDPRHNAKPTLEELLQLKRCERPDTQFWAGFERELRQKQLTALVEKPRWWHAFGSLGRRVYVPAGAAAMVAFALVAIRNQAPVQVSAPEELQPQVEAAVPSIETLPATVVASRYEEPVEVVAPVEHPAPAAPKSEMVAAREEISPSARSIAANLARLEQAEPELLNAVMGSRLSSSARVQTAADDMTAEPTATPARYRLIARYADRALSPEPSAPALVRERIARRLGDGLVDDVSRIGVGGNRVSLKF